MNKVQKKAFTILELLVTLAIITIIGVILWFVLDVPQIWYRTLDTRTLDTASELATAIERYHVAYNYYPWNQTNENYLIPVRNQDRYYYFDPEDTAANFAWIENLVTGGQLERTGAANIFKKRQFYFFKYVNEEDVYVCFAPRSAARRAQAAAACDNSSGKRVAPENYRDFKPCMSNDGTVLSLEKTGTQNLLCVTK